MPSTEVVPALTQSSASYTGSDITVVVSIEQEIDFTVSSSDEGVLVNGKTVTVKNAGTYTITLTLDEEALYLYKWFDQEETNLSTTCTFTVDSIDNDFNANVSIGDLLGENHSYENEEFTRLYDGSESIIDLTKFESLTNYGTPVVTYYSEANGVRTKLADGTYPKDAGSYVVVLSVAASQNYNAFSYEIKLTISKLATVITVPTYNTAQYQKSAEAAKDKGYNYSTAPKAMLESTGEEVFGTFVYGDLEFNHLSGAESTYVITFIPNDSSYAESTAIATINLIDIAYHLDTTSGAKEYYGTLEDALDTVTSGEIWVYPNAKGATINYAVTIDRDVTIASGVTLVMPYGTKASPVRNTDALCSMGDTYANKEATISNRQTSVVVSSNVTLTVNGTLEIAGALGGGGSQCRYAGQTYSSYAELYLEDNAHVNIYGVVKLTGFIEGPDGKITVETNGTIYLPFVYCDHRGGNYLSKVKSTGKNLSPFNRYQFRNIRNATLEMRYSSTMNAYVNLYASGLNSQHAGHSEVLFIGKGGVIELLTEYSYLTAVFDPFNSKCDLRVYGNAQTNDLSISLQMDSTPINLTSKDFDFPIPWNYDISLNKVAGNTDAKNGQFTMGSVYKLLPGSNFTVEEGATLTLEKMILYTSMHTVVGGDTNRPYYDYYNYNDGASVTTTNFSVIPAKFTVNGTLIANYFGGKIYTNVKGATVQIKSGSSVSVNEVTEYKYSTGGFLSTITYAPVTNTLQLAKAGNSGESYSATGTYYSDGSAWYSANYTISYNHNGGSSVANNISVTNGINGYTLTDTDLPTTSTRTHYTFDHWCLNSECEDMNCAGVTAGQVLFGDNVLHAIWSANEYTMNFVNKLPDGSEVATNAQSIKFTILSDLALPSEPDSPIPGYNFSGWFTADGTQLATIVGANFVDDALENGNAVTIYAHWTNETVYEVIIETNTTDADFADSSTQATSSLTLPDLSGKNIDTTYAKYFAGWYVDSALTVPYESFEQLKACAPTGSDNQRTIYAKWANKITITTTSADDADDSDGTYSAKYTITFSETNSGGYFTSDELVKTGGSWYIIPGHYVYLNATESSSISGITNKSYTQFSANATIKVNYDTKDKAASGGSCFTGDTLITLADGSQKRADQVTLEDALLVFNHETGKLEGAGIIFIENDGFADYNVIHLEFSDGRTTKLIYEHGYFDITLNKYVYVDENNYASFIGHEFAVLAGDSYETVTLTNAYLVNEYTSCYSLVTVYHLNYFVDGLFSMPGGIEGLFNMFAFGEGLVYDQESMLADIQTYGLYSYEDFAPYLPYEVYAAFPADYLKVSVGKGMITFEEILGYIEKYLVKNDVI